MSPIPFRRVIAFLFLVLPAAAQSLKLNGPLARAVTGEISFPPRTSPDGRSHVYTADHDGDEVFELYSVEPGGKPVQLLGPVSEYTYPEITLDGASVLLVIDLDGNGATELVVVPIDGSGPAKTLVEGVTSFQQSPDGARLVYLAQGSSGAVELFSMPVSAGDPVTLNGPLDPGGSVNSFRLSGTGRVVYSVYQDTDHRIELFAVPIDGSEPAVELPIPLVQDGAIAIFVLTPDGARVIYTADQEEDERYELFSVASDGSEPPRKLNGALTAGGDVGVLYLPSYPCWPYCQTYFYPFFSLSPDGRWVVYSANQDALDRFELYSAPSDGSRAAVKLSTDDEVYSYLATISHDSAWVIYPSYEARPGELLSVPIDGSEPARRVNAPAHPYVRVLLPPRVSFDSRYVVYQSDQDAEGVFELYSAPIDGSMQPVQLNAPLPLDGEVAWIGSRTPFTFVVGFHVLEDGVAYLAEQEQNGLRELYFALVEGGAAPRKLAAGPIEAHSFHPSFSSTQWLPTFFDEVLFLRGGSTPTQGARRPMKLSRQLVPGDTVRSFQISADSRTVVFQTRTLLAAPINGGEKATEIAGPWPFPDSGSVLDYRPNADASVVVYRADQDEPGVIELYAARGSNAAGRARQ